MSARVKTRPQQGLGNTTWLANWFDPASTRVRLLLLTAALASLLLAAAIPRALQNHVVGGLWILGGVLEPDRRLVVWGAALAVDLLAPIIGYPTPPLGRSRTADYDIEGGAERCACRFR